MHHNRHRYAHAGAQGDMGQFITIFYNIHSLMCFDERIQYILHELCDDPWDVLIFAET